LKLPLADPVHHAASIDGRMLFKSQHIADPSIKRKLGRHALMASTAVQSELSLLSFLKEMKGFLPHRRPSFFFSFIC
jgi:hypothetical protein